nr:immunoglobulin heavy chain junction region [Mus musculus]MBK4189720.1 immunoglobulin heavy chain junction region [Mus musculus]MBK4189721.1 immunoglobulin heavy chain junction region [Mus musculus]MBK4189722.1 immunoglobulin heavy chain junction region [Mus musculus]MBK4189723.1 immunoglobulin heavy chain junction region [Mus musculus]
CARWTYYYGHWYFDVW